MGTETSSESRDDAALEWLHRRRADDFTPEESEAFNQWYAESENAEAFGRMQALDSAVQTIAERPAIAALRKKIREESENRLARRELAANDSNPSHNVVGLKSFFQNVRQAKQIKLFSGAALTLAAAASFFIVMPYWRSIISTEVGEVRSLVLQDETKVVLDTDSRIRIAFNDEERRVYLMKGQAYFDVKSQTDWPFVVQTGNENVTAIGTAFSVSNIGQTIAVVLQEGIVSIAKRKASQPSDVVQLDAGQQWQKTKEGRGKKSDVPDMNSVLGWTKGTLVFRSQALKDIASEVNRYSKIKIKIDSQAILNKEVDAIYKVGKTESFVSALCKILGLDFEYDNQGNIRVFDPDKNA